MSRDERELDWRRHQTIEFVEPSPDLAMWVARYWHVEWRYDQPYRQLVVPYPNVHLSFHDTTAGIHGVSSGHVFKELVGAGTVLGVAFRPGCFRPFLGRPVSTITDLDIPVDDVFHGWPAKCEIPAVEDFLRANLPAADPRAELAAAIVDRIAGGPEIVRVDVLAKEYDTTVRRLQRLFAEYVGVGPKWVIRRYRLHEVTERMARGSAIDWAGLAADLGYADQAHFTRDFTAMFGESPTTYAARY
ncbi:AraC family transcriptional regulator [Actinocrispum wychmicini]|uniref:AraC family transcriptional regulator n=1 Tax=Actinocrispum wychmicini TaxID=1213861 RepID=UPI001FB63369|nr:helix-turn-helix domain-containing protein [Actinocrispum wychmicini]